MFECKDVKVEMDFSTVSTAKINRLTINVMNHTVCLINNGA